MGIPIWREPSRSTDKDDKPGPDLTAHHAEARSTIRRRLATRRPHRTPTNPRSPPPPSQQNNNIPPVPPVGERELSANEAAQRTHHLRQVSSAHLHPFRFPPADAVSVVDTTQSTRAAGSITSDFRAAPGYTSARTSNSMMADETAERQHAAIQARISRPRSRRGLSSTDRVVMDEILNLLPPLRRMDGRNISDRDTRENFQAVRERIVQSQSTDQSLASVPRRRSASPAADQWDTLLTTITPDPSLPSAATSHVRDESLQTSMRSGQHTPPQESRDSDAGVAGAQSGSLIDRPNSTLHIRPLDAAPVRAPPSPRPSNSPPSQRRRRGDLSTLAEHASAEEAGEEDEGDLSECESESSTAPAHVNPNYAATSASPTPDPTGSGAARHDANGVERYLGFNRLLVPLHSSVSRLRDVFNDAVTDWEGFSAEARRGTRTDAEIRRALQALDVFETMAEHLGPEMMNDESRPDIDMEPFEPQPPDVRFIRAAVNAMYSAISSNPLDDSAFLEGRPRMSNIRRNAPISE